MTPQRLVESLEQARLQFGAGQEELLRWLLADLAGARLEKAGLLARLHEALLFVRAYPASAEILERAEEALAGFAARVRLVDATELEEPEISGIAGTGLTAVFTYGVARHLAERHAPHAWIEWDACDEDTPWFTLLPHLIPALEEDAAVEANVPYREWVAAAAQGEPELVWLMRALEKRFRNGRERGDRYDGLNLPVRWELGESAASRTLMRLPARSPFLHAEPLIRRAQVSFAEIERLAPFPERKLSREEGEAMLVLALDTSAARYRQLLGFTYGDPQSVVEVDAGRGVVFYFSRVLAERKLPLRDYLAATIWKNGVPIGYFEGLVTADRLEAGFNIYYSFRDGETAWLYRQMLAACYQRTGARYCVLDPYQIGHGNAEAIASGAFWFYRKLGFRSMDEAARQLTAREERRIAAQPGYRSPARVLRRLVQHPMVFEMPGATPGFWDGFSVRNLGLHIARGKPGGLARAQQQLRRGRRDGRVPRVFRNAGLPGGN
ncbi:MAG: hypothetical protein ABSC08_04700 [Bryobacteraceae bacterium]|jgi:hypothetical protein